MPEPEFSIKRGDTASYLYATLEDADGVAVDIQGATVVFKMGPISGGTLSIAATATNAQNGAGTVDGSTGNVIYRWGTADLATAGWFNGEWTVTYSNGTVQSFPNVGHMLIAVSEDL